MAKSNRKPAVIPQPKELLPDNNFLTFWNGTVKEVAPSEDTYEHRFIPGQGEVVVRFRNFSKAKKYFIFAVTECDVEGWPLNEPRPDPQAIVSEKEMVQIDKQLAAETPAIN